jgi:hypothetical protein
MAGPVICHDPPRPHGLSMLERGPVATRGKGVCAQPPLHAPRKPDAHVVPEQADAADQPDVLLPEALAQLRLGGGRAHRDREEALRHAHARAPRTSPRAASLLSCVRACYPDIPAFEPDLMDPGHLING